MSGYTNSTGRYRRFGEVSGLTLTQAKTLLKPGPEDDGKKFQLSDGNTYVYRRTCVLTADDYVVILPANKSGRFLLAPGHEFKFKIAIAFGTADATALITSPNTTGFLATLGRAFWEVTADWTGGTSSTIGASLTAAPHNTKGDLLGGSAGDVAATLVASAGVTLGTIGTDVAGGVIWKGNVGIRHDRITSAYTAGTGFLHVVGKMYGNPAS